MPTIRILEVVLGRGWVDTPDEGVFKFEIFVSATDEEKGAPDDPRETTDETKYDVERVDGPLVLVLDPRLHVFDFEDFLIPKLMRSLATRLLRSGRRGFFCVRDHVVIESFGQVEDRDC